MNKKQQKKIRTALFIEELMGDRYPTLGSFAKRLQDVDIDWNIDVACSEKTVQRLIGFIKNELGAPIAFNKSIRGFELTDTRWYTKNYFRFDLDVRSCVEEACSLVKDDTFNLTGTMLLERYTA